MGRSKIAFLFILYLDKQLTDLEVQVLLLEDKKGWSCFGIQRKVYNVVGSFWLYSLSFFVKVKGTVRNKSQGEKKSKKGQV